MLILMATFNFTIYVLTYPKGGQFTFVFLCFPYTGVGGKGGALQIGCMPPPLAPEAVFEPSSLLTPLLSCAAPVFGSVGHGISSTSAVEDTPLATALADCSAETRALEKAPLPNGSAERQITMFREARSDWKWDTSAEITESSDI